MKYINPHGSMFVPFPQEKFEKYLASVKAEYLEELSLLQKKHVFKIAVIDFYEGEISVDELAGIALHLWSTLSGKEKGGDNVGDIMLSISELAFLTRAAGTDQGNFEALKKALIKIRNFYEDFCL